MAIASSNIIHDHSDDIPVYQRRVAVDLSAENKNSEQNGQSRKGADNKITAKKRSKASVTPVSKTSRKVNKPPKRKMTAGNHNLTKSSL